MGMGIGINAEHPDAGEVRGRQEPVACGVWFTSEGNAVPKLLKFQDEEGLIHTITHIQVVFSEKKQYCGIPLIEYQCNAEIAGMLYSFGLLYYIERQEWKILWKA